MTLTLSPRLGGYPTLHRSVRSIGSRSLLVIIGGAAAAISAWGARTWAGDMATASTLVAATALAVLALAVAPQARGQITRRSAMGQLQTSLSTDPRSSPPPPSNEAVDLDVEQTQPGEEVDLIADPMVPEPGWVHALRLHVHTLEAALEDQTARLEQAQAQLGESSREAGDLARVGLILKALRGRVSGSPESEKVLDRVEAAVSRLAPTPALQRPALPAAFARKKAPLAPAVAPPVPDTPHAPPLLAATPATVPAPPPLATPVTAPAAPPLAAMPAPAASTAPPAPPEPAPEPASDTPVPSSSAAPMPEAPEPSAEVSPVPEEERVLPVPAPPVKPAPKASRWRRRGAV